MLYLKHKRFLTADFYSSVSKIYSKTYEDWKFIDELEYQIPGLEDADIEGRIVEAIIGENNNYRFAVIGSVASLEDYLSTIYVVKPEEISGTRPVIGETYAVMKNNENKRGYKRGALKYCLNIAILPKIAQEPRFLRLTGNLADFLFSCDGPIEKPWNGPCQTIAYINEAIKAPEKTFVSIKSNKLEITFCAKMYHVDLSAAYKRADKERIAEAISAIKGAGKRVTAKVKAGFRFGTIVDLEMYIERQLSLEKNPLERQLIIRAKSAINPPEKLKSRSDGPFIDGDGCYRDAPGWGGHSAG